MVEIRQQVDELWAVRDGLSPDDGNAREVAVEAVGLLDSGRERVAEIDPATGDVVVHEWLKRAILLLFLLSRAESGETGAFEHNDKIPLKRGFAAAGVRAVPGAVVRFGAFLEPDVVLMPSLVNIGARVGAGTMVDTWATVGSCAQIGRNVHLAGGVGIGGVLEPPNATPVVIEDDCMIGSRCTITQGARVGRGSVLGEATVLNPGIPVIDAETGEQVSRGHVPPNCVVVRAERRRELPGGEFYLPCALILRRLQPGERDHVNEILRASDMGTGV